jgi:arylamine N-acetyltransferase
VLPARATEMVPQARHRRAGTHSEAHTSGRGVFRGMVTWQASGFACSAACCRVHADRQAGVPWRAHRVLLVLLRRRPERPCATLLLRLHSPRQMYAVLLQGPLCAPAGCAMHARVRTRVCLLDDRAQVIRVTKAARWEGWVRCGTQECNDADYEQRMGHCTRHEARSCRRFVHNYDVTQMQC